MTRGLRIAARSTAALIAALAALPLMAQDITLTSLDGTVSVSGQLQAYDGEFFRIETRFGLLTLEAQGVECEGPGCPDLSAHVTEFTIAGAPGIGGRLLPWLMADFAEMQGLSLAQSDTAEGPGVHYDLSRTGRAAPVARISVALASDDDGLMALMEGRADIALSFSELHSAETRELVLALDAFVPVVSPENKLDGIALEDLPRLLTGDLSDWSELGGPDVPITLHIRDPQAGERHALEAMLLLQNGLPMTETAVVHQSNASLARAVMRDPFALGISLASGMIGTRAVPLVGRCGIRLSATPLAIKSEDYPLTLPLFLHSPARRLPLRVRQFIEHVGSPSGQEAIRRAGFVDVGHEAVALGHQGERLARAIALAQDPDEFDELQRMVAAMTGTERLSATFRFEPGSTSLDAQSRGNLAVLARELEAGMHDGWELVFVGFTDAEGPRDVNRRIARARAQTVRDALRSAAAMMDPEQVTLSADGFGPALPMACDDTDWGRAVNRRVEVWRR